MMTVKSHPIAFHSVFIGPASVVNQIRPEPPRILILTLIPHPIPSISTQWHYKPPSSISSVSSNFIGL